ncbi:MAG: universal stress protein [Deltaproteobacteria bacterium]
MCPEEFCPETKFEKLLLAIDWTVFSAGAVREAITVAKQCSSFLYILTVLELNPAYELLGEDFVDKKKREALEHLDSVKAMAETEGVSCETILCQGGDPAKFILDEAVRKNVSMIVVGRHGHTAVERVILGSVTSEVIAKAPCKVLVASVGTRIEYKNMMVATDGSENAQAAVLEALKIAKSCGSHLLVVSVAPSKRETAEAEKLVAGIAAMAAKAGVTVETMTPAGIPHEVITEIGHKRVVDLIVMGTFGKAGLRSLRIGGTTEKVIESAHCAVLVVNPPA